MYTIRHAIFGTGNILKGNRGSKSCFTVLISKFKSARINDREQLNGEPEDKDVRVDMCECVHVSFVLVRFLRPWAHFFFFTIKPAWTNE